jgi:subtilisin family serine protease
MKINRSPKKIFAALLFVLFFALSIFLVGSWLSINTEKPNKIASASQPPSVDYGDYQNYKNIDIVKDELIVKYKAKNQINSWYSFQNNSNLPQEVEQIKLNSNDQTFLVKKKVPSNLSTQSVNIETEEQTYKPLEPVNNGKVETQSSDEDNFETYLWKKQLETDPNIESVFFNKIYSTTAAPNDPLYSKMWSLENIGQTYPGKNGTSTGLENKTGTNNIDLNIESVWSQDTSNSGKGVVVGVVDSGIDYTHPDIENNIWINNGEIPTNLKITLDTNSDNDITAREVLTYLRSNNLDINSDSVINLRDAISNGSPLVNTLDSDNNGYIDDILGWDFVDNDRDPMDDNGHGTHVAGSIAAEKNNNIGIAGIASNVKILGIKAGDSNGGLTSSSIINSIAYGNSKVKVYNFSWGGNSADTAEKSRNTPEGKKIVEAYNLGIITVVAAGNNNTEAINFFPAKLNEVITVGANNSSGEKAHFSNYGNKVDIMAPGQDILSLKSKFNKLGDGKYDYQSNYMVISGTSMASPQIAGVVSLLVANKPNLNFTTIKHILRNETIQAGEFDFFKGYGVFRNNNLLQTSITNLPNLSLNISNNQKLSGTASISGDSNIQGNLGLYSTPLENVAWSSFGNTTSANTITKNINTVDFGEDKYVLVKIDYAVNPNSLTMKISEIIKVSINNYEVARSNQISSPKVDIAIDAISGNSNVTVKYYLSSNPSDKFSTTKCSATPTRPICTSNIFAYIPANTITTSGIYTVEYFDNLDNSLGHYELTVDTNFKANFPLKIDKSGDFLTKRSIINPAVEDIDGDNKKEIIYMNKGRQSLPIDNKVYVVNSDGNYATGFPVALPSRPATNVFEQTINNKPLVIDADNDGKKEIFFVTKFTDYKDTSTSTDNEYILKLYGVDYQGNLLPDYPKTVWKDSDFINNASVKYMGQFSLTASDMNKDGFVDIIIKDRIGHLDLVTAKSGISHSGFPKSITVVPPIEFSQRASDDMLFGAGVAIGDINKDGNMDMVMPFGKKLFVLDKNGNSIAGWPQQTQDFLLNFDQNNDGQLNDIVSQFITSTPTIADINNDGNDEIIIHASLETGQNDALGSTFQYKVFAFTNQGQLLPNFPASYLAKHPFVPNAYQNILKSYSNISVVNLDADPELEMLFTTILPNLCEGIGCTTPLGYYEDVVGIDTDGTKLTGWDRKFPNLFPETPSYPWIKFSTDPVLGELFGQPIPTNNSADTPIFFDVNGDGNLDIITGNSSVIAAYNKDGTEITSFRKRLGNFSDGNNWASFSQITDTDNDGMAELVAVYNSTDRWKPECGDNMCFKLDNPYIVVYELNQPYVKPPANQWSSYLHDSYHTNNLSTVVDDGTQTLLTLENADSLSVQCSSNPVYPNALVNCSGTLPPNITIPAAGNNLYLKTQDQANTNSVVCNFFGVNKSIFNCPNLDVGTNSTSDIITKKLQVYVGSAIPLQNDFKNILSDIKVFSGNPTEAYFVFKGDHSDLVEDSDRFIIKLTNPSKIQTARNILSGTETGTISVKGTIVAQPADYNNNWSYYLDPESISFFEFAIEVCDASIRYVEDHLSAVGGDFLPNNLWCPWNSRLLIEIEKPSQIPAIGQSNWGISLNNFLEQTLNTKDLTNTSKLHPDLASITDTGKVGIGTSNPTTKLSIVGLNNYSTEQDAITAGLKTGDLYRSGTQVKIVNSGQASPEVPSIVDPDCYTNDNSVELRLPTNGLDNNQWGKILNKFICSTIENNNTSNSGKLKTNLASISSNGKIGIGTTTPNSILAVKGLTNFATQAEIDQNTQNFKNGDLYLYNGSLQVVVSGNNSNINTDFGNCYNSTGSKKLPTPNSVSWGDPLNNFLCRTRSNSSVSWGKLKTNLASIVSGDKVGIGTSSPSSVLSVVGLNTFSNNAQAIASGLQPGDFYIAGKDVNVVF